MIRGVKMKKSSVLPPSSTHPVELADWVEIYFITKKARRISRSYLRRLFRDLSIAIDDGAEVHIELTLQEMKRRHQLAGSTYPFTPSDFGMVLESNSTVQPYLFLLCLSTSNTVRGNSGQ